MSDPQVPDLDALLGQAMEMQQQLLAAQEEAAEVVVEGQAGGEAVVIAVTGAMEFRSVRISAEALDADDLDLLGDMVLAALHDAVAKVNALQAQSMGAFGDMLGLGGVLGAGADDYDADDYDADDSDDDSDEDSDDDTGSEDTDDGPLGASGEDIGRT